MTAQNIVHFSKFIVTDQVFYRTRFTYALVNLKPIVPGHVLVVPLRRVERFKDLTTEESIDYMETLQKLNKFIEHVYKADSMNIAIQDGPEAGQSVPHLHTHLIPRHKVQNFGDKIYDYMQSDEHDLDENYKAFYARKEAFRTQGGITVKPDSDRHPRTAEEMAQEAKWLADELKAFQG